MSVFASFCEKKGFLFFFKKSLALAAAHATLAKAASVPPKQYHL
jgi:hypothetical protein